MRIKNLRWSGKLAVLGVATMLLSVSPVAAQVGPDGSIAYEVDGDIFVMNADGTGQTNVTNTPDWQEYDPAWSVDGTLIAFTSNNPTAANPDATFEIFVMNADGTNVVELTASSGSFGSFISSYEPSWSPSGTEIAFTGWRDTQGTPEIYKVPTNGSFAEVRLTDPADFAGKQQPDWSPDGTKILFTWDLGQQDVFVMNPDGTGQVNLTPDTLGWNERSAAWSPDGSRFAFVDDRFYNSLTFNTDIFVRNADGGGEVQVTDHINIDDDPAWSLDGAQITFSSTRGGSYDIYVIDAPAPVVPAAVPLAVVIAAETGVTQLTNSAAPEENPDWGTAEGGGTTCTITGTAGVDVLTGTAGADVICGLAGNDTISGLAGNDTLLGGDGNDTLTGGAGNDAIDGEAGSDTAGYAAAPGAVTVNLAAGTATGNGTDTLAGMENILGSRFADTLTGTTGGNLFTAGAGGDTVNAGAGRDILNGQGGNDVLNGQGGNDTLNGQNGNDTLNGGTGTDTLAGGAGTDSCLNGETLTTCE